MVLAVVGLAILEWGSIDLGLINFGDEYNLRIPRDYIERGIAGSLVLAEGVLAVLSPLLAAFLAGLGRPKSP